MVSRAVQRIWQRLFGRASWSAQLTLADTGCDSLRLLQFVLLLERRLNRALSLDRINLAMRPDDVVTALDDRLRATPPAPRPRVFLAPGLDDDELRLAEFRRDLRSQVDFVLIEYPNWPDMLRPGWGLADIAEAMAEQVLAQSGGAPVLLTGYSFGGEVAYVCACRMVARGHRVRWLGILDTDIVHVPPPLRGSVAVRLRRFAREFAEDWQTERLHRAFGLAFAKLARNTRTLPQVHRWERWWRPLMPLRTQFWFDRHSRAVLRMFMLWRWLDGPDPGPLSVPVTLFRSSARGDSSPPDLGWAPRCPDLAVVPVDGNHHSLFDQPHRAVLTARYGAVVGAIRGEGGKQAAAELVGAAGFEPTTPSPPD